MNSPIPKECYDCHISARTRRQMLNMTNIGPLAKLQTYLRQACGKCRGGIDELYVPRGKAKVAKLMAMQIGVATSGRVFQKLSIRGKYVKSLLKNQPLLPLLPLLPLMTVYRLTLPSLAVAGVVTTG